MKPFLHTCILVSLTWSLGLGLHAQERPSDLGPTDHFIYLHDNTLLREGDFEVKNNLLFKRFFFPTGEKINLAGIKYFQDKNGYYAVFSRGYCPLIKAALRKKLRISTHKSALDPFKNNYRLQEHGDVSTRP
jgi:hypothetical protein